MKPNSTLEFLKRIFDVEFSEVSAVEKQFALFYQHLNGGNTSVQLLEVERNEPMLRP